MTDFRLDTAAIDASFQHACARLERAAFADALEARRLDVWTTDQPTQKKIAGRLGWLGAPAFVRPQMPRLRAFADRVRLDGFSDVVLLGMGGSSLAPEVLRLVLGAAPGFPRIRVLDSVDPDAVRAAMTHADTSLFVLASKSGSTIEPNVMAAEAARRLVAAGHTPWGSRFVAITDPDTELHRRAQQEGFREIFVNPPDIGGRYSALSFFGLVPAALLGLDLEALVSGAERMAAACRAPAASLNPGLALGAFMASAALAGRDKLTLRFATPLEPFGLWVEQLVAESTGKHGTGVVPIAGEHAGLALGADRAVVEMTLAAASARDPGGRGGVPTCAIQVPGLTAIGAEFFRWEYATAAAGFLLGINPFDEPNVQQAKDATRVLLDTYSAQGRLPLPEPHARHEGARLTLSTAAQSSLADEPPSAVLRTALPGDYICFLAFLPSGDPGFTAVFDRIRAEVAARRPSATTLGFGPRYLHSTGQLHKGGANNGVFVLIVAPAADDLPVPGFAFSFSVLETAQAIGDFQSLDVTGRRALLLHLPTRDPALLERALQDLVDAL